MHRSPNNAQNTQHKLGVAFSSFLFLVPVKCNDYILLAFLSFVSLFSFLSVKDQIASFQLKEIQLLCFWTKLQHPPPPGHTPGIWHLCRPGEEGIWLSECSRGWGIWSPCFRGGEFELHPRFHVKSLAWRAIMGDAVLEDFRGKDCAFVANWLRGKGLNKLCAVFEGI